MVQDVQVPGALGGVDSQQDDSTRQGSRKNCARSAQVASARRPANRRKPRSRPSTPLVRRFASLGVKSLTTAATAWRSEPSSALIHVGYAFKDVPEPDAVRPAAAQSSAFVHAHCLAVVLSSEGFRWAASTAGLRFVRPGGEALSVVCAESQRSSMQAPYGTMQDHVSTAHPEACTKRGSNPIGACDTRAARNAD
jgi:hypothetical protein